MSTIADKIRSLVELGVDLERAIVMVSPRRALCSNVEGGQSRETERLTN